MAARWAPVVALVAASACGDAPNSLTGSVGQARDLSFEKVTITATQSALVVQYIRQPGNQITARLAINVAADANIAAGKPAYAGGDTFKNNVKLDRVSTPLANGNPSPDVFPEVNSGSIRLDSASLVAGKPVAGSFGILLGGLTDKDGQVTIPPGYTLNGTFRGTVAAAP